ncbi:MAG: tetratricopeptide repeat protein, partial [Planctomycetota bacterium]
MPGQTTNPTLAQRLGPHLSLKNGLFGGLALSFVAGLLQPFAWSLLWLFASALCVEYFLRRSEQGRKSKAKRLALVGAAVCLLTSIPFAISAFRSGDSTDQSVLETRDNTKQILDDTAATRSAVELIADDYLRRLRAAETEVRALQDEQKLKDDLIAGLERRLAAARAQGRTTNEALDELRGGDPSDLIAFLDEAIEAQTDDLVELHAERYAAAMTAVDYPAALQSAQAAAALAPDDGDAQHRLGFILATQVRYAEALAVLREAERIDRSAFGDDHPEVATDVSNIGLVLQAQGDLPGALAKYREAERI